MRQLHHGLPGGDDLAGLGQGLDDGPVRVGEQQGVRDLVARHLGLGFGRRQLRIGTVEGRLDLVVFLLGRPARLAQLAVPGLVGRRLDREGAGGGDRFLPGREGELEIRRVEAHERLAGADGLPGVDQPLDHLARDAEAEIALDPGGDDARERPLGGSEPALRWRSGRAAVLDAGRSRPARPIPG